jgi:hypothetical protein
VCVRQVQESRRVSTLEGPDMVHVLPRHNFSELMFLLRAPCVKRPGPPAPVEWPKRNCNFRNEGSLSGFEGGSKSAGKNDF